MTDNNYDVPSIRKAIRLIRLLCDSDKPLGVSEISRALDINKNMAFRLLYTLHDEGWVFQLPGEARYMISLKPFEVISQSIYKITLRNAASDVIVDLRKKIGESVYLGVLYEDCVLLVEHLDGTNSVKIAGMVGGRYPLHCNAAGKVLLAHADNEVFERVSSAGFQRFTQNTICDPGKLREHLQLVKSHGWALDNEEHGKGIICFAAPVYDHTGEVIGALGTSVTTITHSAESVLEDMAPSVILASEQVSQRMGFAKHTENK